jgi:hypothetical protein
VHFSKPLTIAIAGALSLPLLLGAPAVSASAALAALISVSGDGTTSTVRAEAMGSAEASQESENRQMTHSDLQPTGRFVRQGDPIVIDVPAGSPQLQVGIGVYGVYAGLNGGSDVDVTLSELHAGTNSLPAPSDGMVFIVNRSTTLGALVTIRGGQPVPVWVKGETTTADFASQLARYSTAPFIELVGDRVFADFQFPIASTPLAALDVDALDVDALITFWDRVVELSNDVYGLDERAAGTAHKYPPRIYITNPDTGAGYASATWGHLTFQNDTNAGADLLVSSRDDQWGLWHEIGHTYQTPQYLWSGLTEVTVNISSLYVQKKLGFGSRLDDDDQQTDLAAFFATPVGLRDFDAVDSLWVKLMLFDQLRRGFGDSFFPRLSQEYRLLVAEGVADPGDDAAKKQLFIRMASKVANRDLTPFFREWGIDVTAETATVIAAYPDLAAPIWNNLVSTTPIFDHELARYVAPTADVRVPQTVFLGQASIPRASVSNVRNADGSPGATLENVRLVADRPGTDAGSIRVGLGNSLGIRDYIVRPVTVAPGTSLTLDGLGDTPFAYLAVDGPAKKLRAIGTGTTAHSYYGGDRYATVSLLDGARQVLATATVRGDDTGSPLVAALDGHDYVDGDFLVVTHEEPARLVRYADDALQPASALATQTFRIVNGELVPVAFAGSAPAGSLVPAVHSRTAGIDQVVAPVVVRVLTADGRPLIGQDVVFSITGSGRFAGGVSTMTVTTDGAGEATSAAITTGAAAGTIRITAASGGLSVTVPSIRVSAGTTSTGSSGSTGSWGSSGSTGSTGSTPTVSGLANTGMPGPGLLLLGTGGMGAIAIGIAALVLAAGRRRGAKA